MVFTHKIIGLSGKLGSGKNYIAEKIIAPHVADKYNILKNLLLCRLLQLEYAVPAIPDITLSTL
jgi:hypothetical protein